MYNVLRLYCLSAIQCPADCVTTHRFDVEWTCRVHTVVGPLFPYCAQGRVTYDNAEPYGWFFPTFSVHSSRLLPSFSPDLLTFLLMQSFQLICGPPVWMHCIPTSFHGSSSLPLSSLLIQVILRTHLFSQTCCFCCRPPNVTVPRRHRHVCQSIYRHVCQSVYRHVCQSV